MEVEICELGKCWTGTIQTSKSQPKGLLNNETYIRHPKSNVDMYKDVKSFPYKFLQKLHFYLALAYRVAYVSLVSALSLNPFFFFRDFVFGGH